MNNQFDKELELLLLAVSTLDIQVSTGMDSLKELIKKYRPKNKSQTLLYRMNAVENEFRVARHKAFNSALQQWSENMGLSQ